MYEACRRSPSSPIGRMCRSVVNRSGSLGRRDSGETKCTVYIVVAHSNSAHTSCEDTPQAALSTLENKSRKTREHFHGLTKREEPIVFLPRDVETTVAHWYVSYATVASHSSKHTECRTCISTKISFSTLGEGVLWSLSSFKPQQSSLTDRVHNYVLLVIAQQPTSRTFSLVALATSSSASEVITARCFIWDSSASVITVAFRGTCHVHIHKGKARNKKQHGFSEYRASEVHVAKCPRCTALYWFTVSGILQQAIRDIE